MSKSMLTFAVGKTVDLVVREAKLLYGVKEEATKIQQELTMMKSFLIDMEDLDDELGDERVRNTAKEIRKIAYDVEDVIECFILVEANKDKHNFPLKCVFFADHLVKTRTIGTEIEDIRKRISHTMGRLEQYRGKNGLTKAGGDSQNKHKGFRHDTYSYTEEDHVVGLAEDINKLVNSLTTNIEAKIKVASIVGMGGSGKTTLARAVYRHKNVKKFFDSIAWVSISQQWDPQDTLHDILRSVSGKTLKMDEVRTPMYVKDKIQEYLATRKYLIVLDDVWTKKALGEILPLLPPGIEGSKIVVTTRFREVVDYPGLKRSVHEPRGLTKEESWELFSKIALSHERDTSSMELDSMKKLAKDMLAKCKGLPLAVVAVGGLLATKETLEEWEFVKKAMSSMVMEVGLGTHSYGAVKQMLALSYNDLPCHLKPCFLHLGVFPEDSQIPTGKLIRMWIAEGFVSSNNIHPGQTLEDLAMDYLYELIGRCIVRVASRNYEGKPKTIEIHDLMRDLCIKKAKELDFLEQLSSTSSNPRVVDTKPRRAIIHSYDKNYFPFFEGNWHLRSLYLSGEISMGGYSNNWDFINKKLSLELIVNNLMLLRLLNLENINFPEGLPSEIGSLVHLRYLGIRTTNIKKLPSTIENLRNLLTLDYSLIIPSCGIEELLFTYPEFLWKMKSLRHIYLPRGHCRNKKLRLDTLTDLQSLVLHGGEWMVEELPKLSETVKKLHIENITTTAQINAAFRCRSIVNDRLHTLCFHYNVVIRPIHSEQIASCRHLRKLEFRGRIDDRFCCFHFPVGIKKLTLRHTYLQSEATMAALGSLPNLSVLNLGGDSYIGGHSYIGTKWVCGEGTFSQLKELTLYSLCELVEWSIAETAMPRLEKLHVQRCTLLWSLPKRVEFITTLKYIHHDYVTRVFDSTTREWSSHYEY